MAVDRAEHTPLGEVFGDETILVNIAKETASGTIAQRIRAWCAQSDRNVYIGRGSPYGNPFSHLEQSAAEFEVSTREEAIQKYREYLLSRPDLLEKLKELKGKRLGCWCMKKGSTEYVCHGQVLLELLYTIPQRD